MENTKPIIELELYIIRHGESVGNAGYGGRTDLTLKEGADPVLTDKGLAQAIAAGEFYSNTKFDAFYSSPLLRAARTAAEILKRQPEQKAHNILPDICEVGMPSEYKGVEIDEIREFSPTAVYADGVDPSETRMRYDKHETPEKVYARTKFVVDYMRSRYGNGEKVVIVSHAAFITNLVLYIMGLDKTKPAFDMDFYNTGVTRVIFYKPGTYKWGDIVFGCINDTAHYTLLEDKYRT